MHGPIEKLKNGINNMTAAQKKVADFILKNTFDTAFFTVDQLANAAGTSTTTIMRLMTFLNYKGYMDFQRALQEVLRNKVNPKTRLEVNLKDLDLSDLWGRCYDKQLNNIQNTFELIPQETLDNVVAEIVSAPMIYITTARGGIMVAQYMYSFLSRMFGNCQIIHADNLPVWSTIIPCLGPTDLVFAISFPRYANRLLQFVKLAHQAQAKVVMVTDSFTSPFAEYSDITLPCLCSSLGFHNSPLSAMMLVDCLINVASVRYASIIKPRLDIANDILSKSDDYIQ